MPLNPCQLSDYRPISNLSFITKAQQLKYEIRSNHSTDIAQVKVVNDVLLASAQADVSLVVLLDLSAFDTINHTSLFDRTETAIGIKGMDLS